MRVIYIHQYFRKPVNGGAIRSYHLAKSLVDNGVTVDLVTTHNHNKIRVENVDGINVHFLPIKYDNKFSFFKRKISFLRFMVMSYLYILKLDTPHYIYASSTPLTVGVTALALKKIKKIPYYFEVRDLWPEAPIQLGIIKNGIVKRLLQKMEKSIYKNASKIVALSPGMKEGVLKITPNKEVILIPNMSDCDFFEKEEKNIKNTFYYGTGDKFVVSYIGAIGKVNNLDSLIDIAKECQDEEIKNISFLVAGRGADLKRLKDKANSLNIKNIRFLGFLNRKDVKKLLNVTDISFISFLDKNILETNSPNKFFDSIASGKLCVVNTKGWIKETIEEHEIGFYYNPKHPKQFVSKLKPFLENKVLLNSSKTNSRKLAENQFSKKIMCEKFTSLFDLDELNREDFSKKQFIRA